MATGLYSGVSGLAIGVGLNKGVTGLWSGASGLITGWGATAFNPLSLFASGEQGAWYDPSDLSTMFQDTAGTTPVTATGQTVGLLLDKSKNGVGTNGASRRNLLTFTEQFDNAAWTKSNATITPNAAVAPDGTMTADKIILASGQTIANVFQNIALAAGTYTLTAYAKAAEYDLVAVALFTSSNPINGVYISVNLTSGAEIGSGPYGTGYTLVSKTITAVGDGWYRITLTGTVPATTVAARVGSPYVLSGSGNGTNGVLGWGAQLETGSTATAYQVITSDWAATMPGNHATQATAASRPIYGIEPFGGRRNLLSWTEDLTNAYWSKNGSVTVTQSTGFATISVPNTIGSGTNIFFKQSVTPFASGAVATSQVEVRCTTGQSIALASDGGIATITMTSEWQKITLTSTIANGFHQFYIRTNVASQTYSFDIRSPQLEVGSTATAYQRVTDQWNVTQAGVPSVSYIQCDGTDDFLLTGTITPGIDKAQVFAGVRKLSDAGVGLVVESSLNAGGNNGAMALFAPRNTGANGDFSYQSRGTNSSPVTFIQLAPVTSVATGISDIAGDNVALRINGAQVAASALDQGTGNYLAYPLYIGRRADTSLPFNGRIYQLIVRFGANLSAATITQTENYTAGKTGIYTVEQLIRLNTLNASGVSYNAYAAADSNGNNYPVTNTVLAANGTPYSVL